ncbi:hypothetical protein [Nitrospira sp. Nam74]
MAYGNQRRMDGPMFAGLLEAWDDTHIGGHAHACACEDDQAASGYRTSFEHRARAPLYQTRTTMLPLAAAGDLSRIPSAPSYTTDMDGVTTIQAA